MPTFPTSTLNGAHAIKRQSPQVPQQPRPSTPSQPLEFPIIADDRERAGGWVFADHHTFPLAIEYRRLPTADYTVDGLKILVERKSAADMLGSITGGHDRFRAEHERMQALVTEGWQCWVVCEGDYGAMCDELDSPASSRGFRSPVLRGICSSWPAKYQVPWHFAGSRFRAEEFTFHLFVRAWDAKVRDEKRAARDARWLNKVFG